MHCSWTERYHEVNVNIGRQTFSQGGPALKININNQQGDKILLSEVIKSPSVCVLLGKRLTICIVHGQSGTMKSM